MAAEVSLFKLRFRETVCRTSMVGTSTERVIFRDRAVMSQSSSVSLALF